MRPEVYAQGLKKKQGMEQALRIAEGTLKTAQIAAENPLETPPHYNEVEISQDERGKERVTVDQPMKLKRLTKGVNFWKQVVNILKKMDAAIPKKQKA